MSAVETITFDQKPTKKKWQLPLLYKYAVNDKLLVWQIGFDGHDQLVTTHGYEDGKKQTVMTEVKLNNSGRNMQEQALLEARSDYSKQIRKGYARNPDLPEVSTFQPMTGYPMKRTGQVVMTANDILHGDKCVQIKKWPVAVQAKLDGIRAVVMRKRDGKLHMYSRGNKEFTHMGHILDELEDFFFYLPEGAVLDGELYNHEIAMGTAPIPEEVKGKKTKSGRKRADEGGQGFTILTSIIKSTVHVHPRVKEIKYFIFDIDYSTDLVINKIPVSNPPYELRYGTIIKALKRYRADKDREHQQAQLNTPKMQRIIQSLTAQVGNDVAQAIVSYLISPHASTIFNALLISQAYNERDILNIHNEYVQMGYEGVMIKKMAGDNPKPKDLKEAEYKQGKGTNILKFKSFQDAEGTIVGVHDSKGTEKGAAVLEVETDDGYKFSLRMRGQVEERRKWLVDPDLVIGKRVTYRFQELSEHGIPRFPVGIAIRDYE